MRLLIALFAFLLSATIYGQNDYSMSFDGVNDYVDVPTSVSLDNISTELTVSVWINPSHLSTNGTHPRIIDRAEGPGGVNDRWLLTWSPTGTVDFGIGSGANGCLGNSVTPLNSWTHVAATFNNGQIHIYVNGVIDASAMSLTTTLIHIQNCNLKIGSAPASSYFPGEFDNAHIWNTALTQTEIQQYMNCPPTGNEEGLIGCWNFEEGSGTTVFDQTENGNDGTINGATWSANVPTSDPSYTDVTACNSYDWNGTTYSESGAYSYLTNSELGCDSTAILNLTINLSDTSYTDITACGSVVWNGTTYTESGTYYYEGVDNNSSLDFGANCDVTGNSWVDCGDVLDMTGSFSVGGWLYNNGCDYTTILSKRQGNSPYNGFHLSYENDGNFEFVIAHNDNSGGEIVGVPAISNQWVHLVGVFDAGNTISIYVDGQLANSQSTSVTSLIDNNAPFLIGSLQVPGGWSWDGLLDDIFIYDMALSSSDINDIFNHCDVRQNNLQGFWNFEEGQGTTAYDQRPNGNDGTINEATFSTNVPSQSCGLTNINGCDSTAVLNLTLVSCESLAALCGVGTIWDSESQECIVANPTDTDFDGCTGVNDVLDILAAYGDCGVAEITCGDDIEHEGYSYSTVQIGDQCWFSENCRYLQDVSPSNEGNTTDPYYYVYGYEGTDVTAAQATANYDTYGVLYNWPAVMTEGICPSGWHIPSDGEWQTMEISLGMSESEAAGTSWRGTDEGYQMKSTSGWNGDGNGSNSSGFNALPGGYRVSGGFGYGGGDYGGWWSASESGSYSWYRSLYSGLDSVDRYYYSRYHGFSARCVRD